MTRRRWAAAGLCLCVVAAAPQLVPAPAAAAGPNVGVADSVTVVRPTVQPTGLRGAASVVAAGNEYESVQLVISGPASQVSVTSDLACCDVDLYREAYYTVTRQSDGEGGVGRWGDALVPEHDLVYGEDRNAFPFDVPDGENRVVWVDVFVPAATEPGSYAGSLTVVSSTGATEVSLEVEVLDFDLPDTSSLANAFMISTQDGGGNLICRAHTGSTDCGGDPAQYRPPELALLAGGSREPADHRQRLRDRVRRGGSGQVGGRLGSDVRGATDPR